MAAKAEKTKVSLQELLETYGSVLERAIKKNKVRYTMETKDGMSVHCYSIEDKTAFIRVERTDDVATKKVAKCKLFVDITVKNKTATYATTGSYALVIHDKLKEKYNSLIKQRSFPRWLRPLGQKRQKVME